MPQYMVCSFLTPVFISRAIYEASESDTSEVVYAMEKWFKFLLGPCSLDITQRAFELSFTSDFGYSVIYKQLNLNGILTTQYGDEGDKKVFSTLCGWISSTPADTDTFINYRSLMTVGNYNCLLFGPLSIVNAGCKKHNNIVLPDFRVHDINKLPPVPKYMKINSSIGMISDVAILAHYNDAYFFGKPFTCQSCIAREG